MANEIIIKSSLKNHFKVAWINILIYVILVSVLVCARPLNFERAITGSLMCMTVIGIPMLGFLAIGVHLQYYFKIEKDREIQLKRNEMIIYKKSILIDKFSKEDIINIILYDKILSGGNYFPTLLDNYYYIVVSFKGNRTISFTSLSDIHLKKKLEKWSGHLIEHKYKFLPYINQHVSN